MEWRICYVADLRKQVQWLKNSKDYEKLETLRNRTDTAKHWISDIELKLDINKINSDKNMKNINIYVYTQIFIHINRYLIVDKSQLIRKDT